MSVQRYIAKVQEIPKPHKTYVADEIVVRDSDYTALHESHARLVDMVERNAAVEKQMGAALQSMERQHRDEMAIKNRECERLSGAISWALGEGDSDFKPRQEGQGAYWWRTELAARASHHRDRQDAGGSMKIYGNISDETMAAHEWVTLDDHLGAIEDEIAKQIALEQQLREAKQECERLVQPVSADELELRILKVKDALSWLEESSLNMRKRLDGQGEPDIARQSDITALYIKSLLEDALIASRKAASKEPQS